MALLNHPEGSGDGTEKPSGHIAFTRCRLLSEPKLGGRVLVIDDHPLTREGVSLAARAVMPGVSVVGAGSANEAASAVQRGEWRMILLDLELPDAHALSALLTLQAHAPSTSIVVVTASLPLDELAAELRRVDRGQLAFPAVAAAPEIRELKARIDTLSPAQLAVPLALADGRSNKKSLAGLTSSKLPSQLILPRSFASSA